MFENVVVGVTDSAGAARAVRRALEVARASGATLHIVAALGSRSTGESDARRDALGRRRLRTRAGRVDSMLGQLRALATGEQVRVTTHPVSAKPAEAITRVALQEHADLIVLGTRNDRGIRRLSSVPKAVMDRAACAVLVV